jgi:hypothetical protein
MVSSTSFLVSSGVSPGGAVRFVRMASAVVSPLRRTSLPSLMARASTLREPFWR